MKIGLYGGKEAKKILEQIDTAVKKNKHEAVLFSFARELSFMDDVSLNVDIVVVVGFSKNMEETKCQASLMKVALLEGTPFVIVEDSSGSSMFEEERGIATHASEVFLALPQMEHIALKFGFLSIKHVGKPSEMAMISGDIVRVLEEIVLSLSIKREQLCESQR